MSRAAILVHSVVAVFALGASGYGNDIDYTVTDLGTLGGPTSRPTAINSLGEVVGIADLPTRYGQAFAYSGTGPMVGLGSFAGPNSVSLAEAVNDSGTVVGYSDSAGTSLDLAFVYTQSGGMRSLPTFGGSFSEAPSVNNAGQVAGISQDATGTPHGFLWSSNAPMLDLGQYHAILVNNGSLVVAVTGSAPNQRTFFASGGTGTWTDIGSFGGTEVFPDGLDNRGDIVGWANNDVSANPHAFLYSNGTLTNLGDDFGGNISYADAINNFGVTVGQASLAGDTIGHAFIKYPGAPMEDLNDLIDPALGWGLGEAFGINNLGQIAVGADNSRGIPHAVLLTPVPEPSSLQILAMLAFPLLMCAAIRLHRMHVPFRSQVQI